MKKSEHKKSDSNFAVGVGKALNRSAKNARKTAKQYGTPVYIWQDGKVVALKP